MQLKMLCGSAVLVSAVGLLCDRAIHGPPELILVWLLATIGVAAEGVVHLRLLAERPPRLATAIVRERHDCRG